MMNAGTTFDDNQASRGYITKIKGQNLRTYIFKLLVGPCRPSFINLIRCSSYKTNVELAEQAT